MLPPYKTSRMRSKASGLDYEIFVYVPDTPPPEDGFPTLFVLDANSDFLIVAETLRRVSRRPLATGIAPAIVVGIGYPNTQSYDLDRRYLDFTRGPSTCPSAADIPASACGGQEHYVRFFAEEVLPDITSRYPSDPGRRSILGHSLAGYFVLELLASHPGLFSAHVSFSPSIWWDRDGLAARLAARSGRCPAARLYIAAGRYEQELAPWQRADHLDESYLQTRLDRRMVDSAREIARLVGESDPGAAVRFELGEEEDHATIVNTLLCRALRFVNPAVASERQLVAEQIGTGRGGGAG